MDMHQMETEDLVEDGQVVKVTTSPGVMQMAPMREDEGGGSKKPNPNESTVITGTVEGNESAKLGRSNGMINDLKVEFSTLKVEVPIMEGDTSRSDQGSARVSSLGDDQSKQGTKRGRRRKTELEDTGGGMETPLRHQLDRSAKSKGDTPTKSMKEGIIETEKGEVQSLILKHINTDQGIEKGEGESLILKHPNLNMGTGTQPGVLGGDDEAEAASALAAVMEVHRIPKDASEPLADHPGETGVGSKKQCDLCKKSETPKTTIICDKCECSYHLSCVKLKSKQALDRENEHWQCDSCGKEINGDFWPLGRVTSRHDRSKADARRIETKSNGNHVKIHMITPPAGELSVVKADPATVIIKEVYPGPKVSAWPAEREKDEQFMVYEKEGTGMEDYGKSVKKRGRPRKEWNVKKVEQMTDGQYPADSRDQSTALQKPPLISGQVQALSTPILAIDTHEMSPAIDMDISGDAATLTMSEDDFQNDEKQRREAEESLEDLRRFISSKNGSLQKGWGILIKRRPGNTRVCDKCFVSPDNQKFRSRLAVARFLGLLGRDKNSKKSVDTRVQTLTKGLELPLRYGDLSIESFGDVTRNYADLDNNQVSPVGYQTSWHDLETGSLCISEVIDGGDSGAVFRVKRKSCMTLAKSAEISVTDRNSVGEGKMEDNPLSTFQVQGGSLNIPNMISSEGNVMATDSIGELVVEAKSSAAAWRDFAKLFVLKLQGSGIELQSLASLCSHAIDVSTKSSIGSEPRVSVEPVSSQNCLSAEVQAKVMECPQGIDLAEGPAVYRTLEERLSVDRFGLNERYVQELIYGLLNGRKNEEKPEDPKLSIPLTRNLRRRDKRAQDESGASDIGIDRTCAVSLSKEILPDITVGEVVEERVKQPDQRVAKQAPIVKEHRSLPLAGDLLTRRLPAELVGDALQVWEFLCRFSEVIGLKSPLTYEDLESGLVDLGPPLPAEKPLDKVEVQPILDKALEVDDQDRRQDCAVAGLDIFGEPYGAQVGPARDPTGEVTGVTVGGESILAEGQGRELNEIIPNSNLEMDVKPLSPKPRKPEQDAPLAEGGVQPEIVCVGEGTLPTSEQTEASPVERAVAFSDGTLNETFIMIAKTHIPLLKLLLADLQFRIVGSANVTKSEEPKKKGRKPLNEPPQVISIPEFPSELPINEVTWPELVRRYLMTLIEVEKFGDLTDLRQEERKWLMRCLQGDGGVLCGALFTVVGVESDAQVLAEAEKEVTSRMPKGKEDEMVEEDEDLKDDAKPLPNWVEVLRPVAKMATNVGARIRTKVKEALELAPPEWARENLEWAISKDVFKGNASGPTKRAVMEVLKNYDVFPSAKSSTKKAKTKRMVPSSEQLMQRCRFVLRAVADADKTEAFSILVGGPEGHGAGKLRGMVARPLDFRTIDARLAAGAYGGSVEAFAADVRQIWRNVESLQKGGELMELAANLSQLFEDLFKKQVINLMSGIVEVKPKEPKNDAVAVVVEGKDLVNAPLTRSATAEKPDEDKLQKAPWQDNDTCRVCGIDEDYESIMLCDKCDAEYHTYCLNPPLDKVPEGNWFCPECVAVAKGFPDKPSGKEGEVVEPESLEGEDDQFPADGNLDDAETTKEVNAAMVETAAQCLLKQVEAHEYWQLGLSERIHLLKFLCEEALKTTQVRQHLEKSLDVASELQEQLRKLYANREEAVLTIKNQEREALAKLEDREQIQIAATPEGQITQGHPVNRADDSNKDSWLTRLRHQNSGPLGGANESPALPRLLEFDADDKGGVGPARAKSTMESLDEAVVQRKHHSSNFHDDGHDGYDVSKLKEIPGAGLPSNGGDVSDKMVHERSSMTLLDTSLSVTNSTANVKKRKQDDVDEDIAVKVLVADASEGNALERNNSTTSKRVKSNEDVVQDEIGTSPSAHMEEVKGTDGMDGFGLSNSGGLAECDTGSPEKNNLHTVNVAVPNGVENQSCEVSATAPYSDSSLAGDLQRSDEDAKAVDVTLTPGAKNSPDDGVSTDLGSKSARRVPLRSCRVTSDPAITVGTGLKKGTTSAIIGLPPRTPKRKLEMNSSSETQKKLKRNLPACNGAVQGKESEVLLKTQKIKSSKQSPDLSESAQGAPALGEVIDVPPGDKAHSDPSRQKAIHSPLTRSSTMPLDPVLKLNAEIAKVELKLYNTSVRRDHLGTDDLGRDYWGLSGTDQVPLLVVSECDHVGRAEFEGVEDSTFSYSDHNQKSSCGGDRPQNDDSAECSKEKKVQWWAYKQEESVQALVAWLNSRLKLESALKKSICQWWETSLLKDSRSLESPGHAIQGKDPDCLTQKTSFTSKDTDGSPRKGRKTLQKTSSKKFPTLRATSILQMRYGTSTSSDIRSMGKKSTLQMDGRVTRCTCLEPLWRFRWHCQGCHETYESSTELDSHKKTCLTAVAAQSQSKKKQKSKSGKGKKTNTPEKGKKHSKSVSPKKEGTQGLAERDDQLRLVDENSWMTEEATEPVLHRHATRSKTQTPPMMLKSDIDATAVGDWAMEEEPMDAFFLSDFQDDLHNPGMEDTGQEDLHMGFGSFSSLLQDEEWEANLRPEKSEAKKKKQSSGKKSSKQIFSQGASEEALANFDYASIPMSFSTPDSTRDRILQIGCIADQGPTFAPALHFAPAFDPSLMIQPCYPSVSETPTNREEIPVSPPPPISSDESPTGELDTKDFDGGRLDAVSWYDPQSSGEIPSDVVFAPATGDIDPVVHPETGATWDYKWDELVGLPTLESEEKFEEKFVPEVEAGCTVNATSEECITFTEEVQPTYRPPPPELTFESIPEQLAQPFEVPPDAPLVEVPTVTPSSVVAKKPSKKFGAPDASLRPLIGEQFGVLKGLKMRLLDMEAAMGCETLVPARSAPERLRAWRSFVKSAECIYEMTKAVIILEQMVRAECLKKTWCHWSSLSAAARSITLSSLALKVFALDAAVTYRKEKVDGEEPQPTTVKKGKKVTHVEVLPSSKKKKPKSSVE